MNLIHNIKKNIVAVLGMAMMIGLSAWSLTSEGTENSKAVTPVEKAEPALYWYEADLVNNTIGNQVNTSPQTKSESMPGGSNQITDCEDQTAELCLVGFEAPQSPNTPLPTNPDEEHSIRKTAQ
jgi:hypothetical protein